MADIEVELQALRGQILRVKSELEALAEAESVLSEKLRALGLDESVTTVDLPTVAGLPSRRKKRPHSSAPPPARGSAWVGAAVGAGLMLGVAIVVLLAMNLQRRSEPATALAPTVTSLVVQGSPPSVAPPSVAPPSVAPPSSSPPPPPPPPPPALPAVESASAEPPKPEMGTLSIVCTPRCDSLTDNGAALSPGSVVSLPVPAGVHKVVATAGASKRSLTVSIQPNQTKEVRIDLERRDLDRGF